MLTHKIAEEIQAVVEKVREDLEKQRLEIAELQGRNENELFEEPSDDLETAAEMATPENNFNRQKFRTLLK